MLKSSCAISPEIRYYKWAQNLMHTRGLKGLLVWQRRPFQSKYIRSKQTDFNNQNNKQKIILKFSFLHSIRTRYWIPCNFVFFFNVSYIMPAILRVTSANMFNWKLLTYRKNGSTSNKQRKARLGAAAVAQNTHRMELIFM